MSYIVELPEYTNLTSVPNYWVHGPLGLAATLKEVSVGFRLCIAKQFSGGVD